MNQYYLSPYSTPFMIAYLRVYPPGGLGQPYEYKPIHLANLYHGKS
jgi:hypothetical protein